MDTCLCCCCCLVIPAVGAILGLTCQASPSHTILGWLDVRVELVASSFFDVVVPLTSTIYSTCEECFLYRLSCPAMWPKYDNLCVLI